ncbi:MAG: hypothetical protein GWN01_10950 [Nitrosopumilaceae archaeon]|nr:hypothetical protein [Nitrosopumilaceae archaeon]NIU01404.1 hypothetical protein [Nitrosopumilaceae archaeon]NIU87762.1 hypothetical protein [Nitrosopumilaceae archaeon]NIV66140.1 hypothetical protein [Nitrosopumilaceae archaeon]NIX62006.1 hypothetical protein [Nitrosopumilaceae archaeon]
MTQQVFENTFAPNSRNKEFTLSQIISGIKHGVIDFDTLPHNIKEIVRKELKKRDL